MSSRLGRVRSTIISHLRRYAAQLWTWLRPGVIQTVARLDTDIGIVVPPTRLDRYRRPIGLRRR